MALIDDVALEQRFWRVVGMGKRLADMNIEMRNGVVVRQLIVDIAGERFTIQWAIHAQPGSDVTYLRRRAFREFIEMVQSHLAKVGQPSDTLEA